MLKLKTLKIKRTGLLNFRVSGPNHCGPVDQLVEGRIPVSYVCEITCAPVLDKRGFLVDQMGIDKWLRSWADAGTNLSCESLASAIGERLLAKIARDHKTCEVLALKVILSPAPHLASIEAEF